MSLQISGIKNIFPHSKDYSQGMGQVRKGAGTFIVALDGSGDFDDIQEAIDALPNTGGEIYIKEGTYEPNEKIKILKSNVSLIGSGNSTIIKPKINDYIIQIGNGTTTLSKIVISDLQIDGINQTGYPANGIYINGGASNYITETIIKNCNIKNCYWTNIYLEYTENCIIENNLCVSTRVTHSIFTDNYNLYIKISGNILDSGTNGLTMWSNTQYSTIDENIIRNMALYGMELWPVNYSSITGNITEANGDTQIRLICWGVSVTGNIAKDGGGKGFELSSGNESTITGNVSLNNTTDGFNINSNNNTIISSNISKDNGGTGIILDAYTDRNIVTSNLVLNNTTAQITDNGTNTLIANNITI